MNQPFPFLTGHERWLLPGVILFALALRVALALGTDLYFDEAYYWTWAQALDWSYFDHPPFIAWIIAAVGVRPAALLCGAFTAVGVLGLARDVHGSPAAGMRAAALWLALPAGALAGFMATPDSPLLLFWVLALWALWRERWWLAGALCGLALLSKYVAVLLPLAFLAVAVSQRRLPRRAWLSAGVAAACFAPVVAWNAAHGFEGFGFQLNHGLGGSGGLRALGVLLAGQLALAGPIFFPLAVLVAVRPGASPLLRASIAAPLLLFGLAALKTRGEANWPAAAYLGACVALAAAPSRWVAGAMVSSLAVSLAGGSHLLHPILRPERDVPLARLQGWSVLKELGGSNAAVAFAPSYQLASEVAYHAKIRADVAGPARRSQYDLWPPSAIEPRGQALWVSEGVAPPPALAARFDSVIGPRKLTGAYAGRTLHEFHIWQLVGYRGPAP